MVKAEYLKTIDEVITRGRFKDDWASLCSHKTPEWYMDAKVGVFIHWGIFSVPAFGNEWYSRHMYDPAHEEFRHHRETFGDQKDFGYKDFIPLFKGERFSAEEWVTMFKEAGIRYVMPVAEHHDGFAMYRTEMNRWNAAEMGPGRDVVGEIREECLRQGLAFCASTHRAEHYFFMNMGRTFPSDVQDEEYMDFYGPAVYREEFHSDDVHRYTADTYTIGPTEEWMEDWLVRTCELIDNYRPSVLYFDWWVHNHAFKPYLRKLAAYYYNRAEEWRTEVTITYKHEAFPPGAATFDVNSRFTDNLSNQFIATYSKKDDIRGSNSSEFPHIDIKKPYNGNDQIYMALGYELFTWNNGVHDKVFNVKDDVTYFLGAHKLTAGVKYEYKMADNAYMRNGTGYYRYNTLEDFLNGATPDVVALTYGYDGETNPAARVQQHTVGFYLQDEWNVNEKFNLTAGVRFDGLFFDENDLMTNKAIYDLTYYTNDGKERHVDTGRWPDMHVTISPRVGFTYDVFGDRSLKLRGGTGLFQGNLPLVFFTNMPTNSGMVQYQAAITASEAAKRGFSMDAFSGGLVTDSEGKPTINALRDKLISLGYPATIKPEDGTKPSSICGVDTKFKLPQVWKTSLAVDYQFPVDFPLSLTVEGIYHKAINLVSISDWAIPSVGGFARFNGVDNRPIYPAGFRTNTKAFILENTSRGYGWSFSSTLNASPAEWIDLMVAYTHTANKEVTGMPGSAAESAFTYVPTYEGPNNIPVHNSQYVTPDRVVASATINDKSGNHYSFIYEASRGGYNYSYMMLNDMNGDGYNYDAIYIPTDEEAKNGQMRFVTDDDRDRFMAYVHEDSYLKSHQGQYSEAYSIYTPWLHRVDFSYKHDFKFKVAGQKNMITLSADIKNVMNLFNNKWGVAKWLNPEIGTEARILKYEGVDADGYATFSTPDIINGETETFTPNYSLGQCWYMSIGIKYTFN